MLTVFVLERDNPKNTPEPQVFTDGMVAFNLVKEEYNATMKELGTSQAMADAGYGNHFCLWAFEESGVIGSAMIDSYELDRWYWRITEHKIKVA